MSAGSPLSVAALWKTPRELIDSLFGHLENAETGGEGDWSWVAARDWRPLEVDAALQHVSGLAFRAGAFGNSCWDLVVFNGGRIVFECEHHPALADPTLEFDPAEWQSFTDVPGFVRKAGRLLGLPADRSRALEGVTAAEVGHRLLLLQAEQIATTLEAGGVTPGPRSIEDAITGRSVPASERGDVRGSMVAFLGALGLGLLASRLQDDDEAGPQETCEVSTDFALGGAPADTPTDSTGAGAGAGGDVDDGDSSDIDDDCDDAIDEHAKVPDHILLVVSPEDPDATQRELRRHGFEAFQSDKARLVAASREVFVVDLHDALRASAASGLWLRRSADDPQPRLAAIEKGRVWWDRIAGGPDRAEEQDESAGARVDIARDVEEALRRVDSLGIAYDRDGARDALLGTVPGWEDDTFPLLLDAFGLNDIVPAWRAAVGIEPGRPDGTATHGADTAPEPAPATEITGGPVEIPGNAAWLPLWIPRLLAGRSECRLSLTVRHPTATLRRIPWYWERQARVESTDGGYTLEPHWPEPAILRRLESHLASCPDGSEIEWRATSRFDGARHRYEGERIDGAWRMRRASPPADAGTLGHALALALEVDRGTLPLQSADESERDRALEILEHDSTLGRHNVTVDGLALSAIPRYAGDDVLRPLCVSALGEALFRARFAGVWDVSALLEEARRQAPVSPADETASANEGTVADAIEGLESDALADFAGAQLPGGGIPGFDVTDPCAPALEGIQSGAAEPQLGDPNDLSFEQVPPEIFTVPYCGNTVPGVGECLLSGDHGTFSAVDVDAALQTDWFRDPDLARRRHRAILALGARHVGDAVLGSVSHAAVRLYVAGDSRWSASLTITPGVYGMGPTATVEFETRFDDDRVLLTSDSELGFAPNALSANLIKQSFPGRPIGELLERHRELVEVHVRRGSRPVAARESLDELLVQLDDELGRFCVL